MNHFANGNHINEVNSSPALIGSRHGFHIVETISRGCVPSLRSVFKSSAQAIKELVDNAVNYRGNQQIFIDIAIDQERVVVQNIGGRGMAAEHLANYVSWGSGEEHGVDEISQYRVGGKAAVQYLGNGFRIWSRLSGSSDHWHLEDLDFSTRNHLKDYGEIWPLSPGAVPAHLLAVANELGYVRVEVLGRRPELKIDPEAIGRELAITYKPLIAEGCVVIRVNGANLIPSNALLDDEIPTAPIHILVEGLSVHGWAAKLARGPGQPKPGFTLFSKGRRILDSEWFTQNPFSKGALSSFYGELVITGLTLNVNKSDYVERGTQLWDHIGRNVIEQAAPVLDELRGQGSAVRITEHDRKIARQVRKELEALLDDRTGEGDETVIVQDVVVRVVHREREQRIATRESGGNCRRFTHVRESHPRLEAVDREIQIGGLPEVVVESWDAPVRSITRLQNGQAQVVINKQHPAYSLASARFVIAECVLAEVLGSRLAETVEYKTQVDGLLAEWADRHCDAS